MGVTQENGATTDHQSKLVKFGLLGPRHLMPTLLMMVHTNWERFLPQYQSEELTGSYDMTHFFGFATIEGFGERNQWSDNISKFYPYFKKASKFN